MATRYPIDTSAGVGNGMRDPTALTSESSAVTRELKSFVADLEDLVTATTSLTAEDLANAKAKLTSRLASASETARGAGIAVDNYTHANPWKAAGAGVAAGTIVGLLLGVLFARRA